MDAKATQFYDKLYLLLREYNASLRAGFDVETYEPGGHRDHYIDVFVDGVLIDSRKVLEAYG